MNESFEEQIAKKSDGELTDIFIEDFKYQPDFIELVKVELIKRNIPLDSILTLRKKNEKIIEETLSQGEQGSPVWIAIGFIAPIVLGFVSTFGGIFSVFLGYSYAFSKQKKDEKEYYVYNASTRKFGQYMFYIYLTIIVFALYRYFFLN